MSTDNYKSLLSCCLIYLINITVTSSVVISCNDYKLLFSDSLLYHGFMLCIVSGERELIEFLAEEIATESKNRKVKTLPSEVDGFKVQTDAADVVFTKASADET